MMTDWNTKRASKSPSMMLHRRFTALPFPVFNGLTVASTISAGYLSGGRSSRGGVPLSLSVSKPSSRIVECSLMLAPVLGELGDIEVSRQQDFLRHPEPVLSGKCRAPLGEEKASGTGRSSCALAVIGDCVQVLREK